MCEPAYPEALLTLEQIVNDRKDLRFRSWMLDEALSRGIEFSKVPTDIETVCEALEGKDRSEQQNRSLNWRGLSTVLLIRIMRRWLIRR